MKAYVAVLFASLTLSPGWSDTFTPYPGCPNSQRTITFVNQDASDVTIKEIPSCYPTALAPAPFNNSKCWPFNIPEGSLTVKAGTKSVVTVPSCWSGNYGVPCTKCKSKIQTLAEFTFDGGLDSKGDKLPGLIDTYDVSMVDGFTKALSISADKNVQPAPSVNCGSAGCSKVPICPETLKQEDGSCRSPNIYVRSTAGFTNTDILKYGCVCSTTTDSSCITNEAENPKHDVPAGCVGQFGCSPFSQPGQSHPDSACCPFWADATQGCQATSSDRAWDSWALDYIKAIHDSCPGQYAWQFDDQHGTFTCQGSGGALMNYTITISPQSSNVVPPPAIQILRIGSYAGNTTGVPLPGAIGALIVTGLTGVDSPVSSNAPTLPTTLAGVQVTIAGTAAPIYFIAPGTGFHEIVFQVPWEISGKYPVRITQGSNSATLTDSADSGWGVFFSFPNRSGIVQRAAGNELVTPFNPARPGEWIVAYGSNLGPVTVPQSNGVPTPLPSGGVGLPRVVEQCTQVPTVQFKPMLRINGTEYEAVSNYIGLTPTTIGVYQVNVQIPAPIPSFTGQVSAELYILKVETFPDASNPSCNEKTQTRYTLSHPVQFQLVSQ